MVRKIHLDDSGRCTDVVANKELLEDIHICILVSYPCVLYLTLEMNVADRMTAGHPTFNKEKPWVTTGATVITRQEGILQHWKTWGRATV